MDKSPGPLTFAASFSPDARLAATAGDLAAKFAQTTGCAEAAIQELREAVGKAFEAALEADGAASIDLALRAAETSFATDLTCGARSYLHVAHPRTA
jgi:hypothetical protein